GRSYENFSGCENLGDAGFVVCAQKGGAVGDNQMLAPVAGQAGKIGFPHDNVLALVEQNVAAVVKNGAGLNICAGGVGRRVHVGDQADDRLAGIAGNGAVDIAVAVHVGVGDAHGL